MIRLSIVCLMYGVGTLWGLQAILGAGCFLIWNDIFRPAAWARHVSFLHPSVFPSHHLTFAVLMFATIFTTWKKRWNAGTTILLILVGWIWVCAIRAQHQVPAYAKAIEATKYLVPSVIMSLALCSRRYQQIFIYALAYAVGIWMAWSGLHTLLKGSPEIHMSIPDGQMTDRNDFLVAGTGCLPLLIYTAFHYNGRWQKWVRIGTKAMVFLSVIAFFTSLSRGAIVGLTALIGFYAVATGRVGRRLIIAGCLLAIAVVVTPSFVWERLGTIDVSEEQTEQSAASRVAIMATAVEVTLDYPIFGVGPANFPHVALAYDWRAVEPHSIWLKCSSEFGLTMLVFFIAILVSLCTTLRRIAMAARARNDKDTEGLATALACAIFGFVATGSFTSQFLSEYLWAIIAVSGAFIAAEKLKAREEFAAAKETAEPQTAGAV